MTFLLKSTFISERLKMVGLPALLFLLFVASTGHSQPREIHIKAVGGLQFDKVRFKARPGEQLRIILTNTDDMDHNMLFTKPGRREAVVEAATNLTDQGPDLQFVPNTPDVLWASSVIGPGEADIQDNTVSGGGKPTMAQAGGRDVSRLDEALAKVDALVGEAISKK